VISPQTISDRVRQAFMPTPLGVAGLTDQLIGACAGGGVEFERVGDRCAYRWTVGGETHEGTAPFPPAAFRTVLARVAALCNESRPDSVTPYRGEGVLSAPGHAPAAVRVRFVNTPDQQRLTLDGAGPTQTVEGERRSESPGVETWPPGAVSAARREHI